MIVHNQQYYSVGIGRFKCRKQWKTSQRSGLCPDPRWGRSQSFPEPLAGGRGCCLLPKNPPPFLAFGPLVLPQWKDYWSSAKTELAWNRSKRCRNWSDSLLSWQWPFTSNAAEVLCIGGNISTLQYHPVSQNTSELEVRLRLHGATNDGTNALKDWNY